MQILSLKVIGSYAHIFSSNFLSTFIKQHLILKCTIVHIIIITAHSTILSIINAIIHSVDWSSCSSVGTLILFLILYIVYKNKNPCNRIHVVADC